MSYRKKKKKHKLINKSVSFCYFIRIYLPRVQHLLFDLGGIRAPGHEEQLLFLRGLRRTLTLMHILEIVETVAAFARTARLQILKELVVFLVTGPYHLNIDLSLIFNEENYVAVFLVFFYLFVRRLAYVRNCHSWRLWTIEKQVITNGCCWNNCLSTRPTPQSGDNNAFCDLFKVNRQTRLIMVTSSNSYSIWITCQ